MKRAFYYYYFQRMTVNLLYWINMNRIKLTTTAISRARPFFHYSIYFLRVKRFHFRCFHTQLFHCYCAATLVNRYRHSTVPSSNATQTLLRAQSLLFENCTPWSERNEMCDCSCQLRKLVERKLNWMRLH